MYTIEAPNPSTTVFVVGGMHGNEGAGVEASHLVSEYAIDRSGTTALSLFRLRRTFIYEDGASEA